MKKYSQSFVNDQKPYCGVTIWIIILIYGYIITCDANCHLVEIIQSGIQQNRLIQTTFHLSTILISKEIVLVNKFGMMIVKIM